MICTKDRADAFDTEEVVDEVKTRTRRIAETYDITVKNQEMDTDHTHILFRATRKPIS